MLKGIVEGMYIPCFITKWLITFVFLDGHATSSWHILPNLASSHKASIGMTRYHLTISLCLLKIWFHICWLMFRTMGIHFPSNSQREKHSKKYPLESLNTRGSMMSTPGIFVCITSIKECLNFILCVRKRTVFGERECRELTVNLRKWVRPQADLCGWTAISINDQQLTKILIFLVIVLILLMVVGGWAVLHEVKTLHTTSRTNNTTIYP